MNRHPASYVDPNGFLFEHEGEIKRAIYPDRAEFYKKLLNDESLKKTLEQKFSLIETRQAISIESLGSNFLVDHPRIDPVSYCTEWPPQMLKDAALCTLNLEEFLLEKDMTLQDAYPWNVLFDGCRPVFVDFTSIVPDENNIIWKASSQFDNFFTYPLLLSDLKKGFVARSLLRDVIQGCTLASWISLLSFFDFIKKPSFVIKLVFLRMVENFLEARPSLKKSLRAKVEELASKNQISKKVKVKYIQSLRRKIEGLCISKSDDVWSRYYEKQDVDHNYEKKCEQITELVQKFKPKTVADLGCNTGRFSIIAAKNGARVYAVDSSEICIDELYLYAKREKLTITPLVSDLVCPQSGYGMLGKQFPGILERIPSDMVLFLGIMHHCHIAGRMSFELISEMLNVVTKKTLIFEYVDLKDPNNDLIGKGREIFYTRETVINSLEKYFSKIEVIPSDRETRSLLLCQK